MSVDEKLAADRTDPAASMALLRMLTEEAGHSEYDDYALAHQRPAAHPGVRASVAAAAVVAIAGLILGAAISQVRISQPSTVAEKHALIARINHAQGDIAALTKKHDSLTNQVEVLRNNALENSSLGMVLEQYLTKAAAQAQYTAVSGSGATVTMSNPDPNKPLPDGVDPQQAQVLDSDVQQVVNGLWQAGATAITINGFRLTSTTAIRSAGGSILVSYHPVLSPYVIAALGPKSLAARFKASSSGRQLAQLAASYGIGASVAAANLLHLDASSAALPDVSGLHVTLPLPKPATAAGGTQ